jgi:hypothetical protein
VPLRRGADIKPRRSVGVHSPGSDAHAARRN